ncbi:MAG: hypothetical protein KGM40_07700 [Betaproteobacteria bacterium]|nr:hypothetical protein [Betaproteobacteria bacterium]
MIMAMTREKVSMRFDGKKSAAFALVALLGLTLAVPASADRGWGGGGWGRGEGWGRGGGWGWGGFGVGLLSGAVIGSALARPYYYPPYYYAGYPAYPAYPTTVVVQQQAPAMPAYVQAPQAPAALWYYCDAAGGYYPYVQSCPQPWRPVPAQ